MTVRTEPNTGLQFVELSHPWHHNQPVLPGHDELILYRSVNHAKHGVMSQKFKTTFHTSTHVNAPIHLVSGAKGIGELPLETFWGTGVVISIPKQKWQQVSAADLASFDQYINAGDIVLINTGWHHLYADSQAYFGHSPGITEDAAQWFVDKKIKMLGVDTPQVDHPLATSLGLHRNGPTMKRLAPEYEAETGRSASEDFPDWIPAHKLLLQNGIPTIENVGGDLDSVTGKRTTFHAMPWRWNEGDACVIRLMAISDPNGQYRIEPGTNQE
ncbi:MULTISPECIES: cyclase family protein [Alteromonadaceae]|uniref:cyclase family protein n=1 Tax=Alteromonadaceae TaxID=72275 RepID=UPI001C0A1493|nr:MULTISPECIES: cyclase family protein [Aliiglaciecola]MBU2876850.1 cyclase family protein [Aliiglaciecola lipolytica]MDO6711953.1 cyclase family protein [Aliiglaciecola sp. 2_MG-2023]MDO6753073.1 cyclase family protein [Aliiglaciecola sp. 1_MG-2023]